MGPGRFLALRIGGDTAEVSDSGQTSGESDSTVMVVHRVSHGNLISPWVRARTKSVKSYSLAALNI